MRHDEPRVGGSANGKLETRTGTLRARLCRTLSVSITQYLIAVLLTCSLSQAAELPLRMWAHNFAKSLRGHLVPPSSLAELPKARHI